MSMQPIKLIEIADGAAMAHAGHSATVALALPLAAFIVAASLAMALGIARTLRPHLRDHWRTLRAMVDVEIWIMRATVRAYLATVRRLPASFMALATVTSMAPVAAPYGEPSGFTWHAPRSLGYGAEPAEPTVITCRPPTTSAVRLLPAPRWWRPRCSQTGRFMAMQR